MHLEGWLIALPHGDRGLSRPALTLPAALSPACLPLFLSLPRSLGQLLWLARSEVQIFKMAEGRNFNVIVFVFTCDECSGSVRGDVICIAMAHSPLFIPVQWWRRLLHRRRRRQTRMCVVSTQAAGGAACGGGAGGGVEEEVEDAQVGPGGGGGCWGCWGG